MKVNVNRIPKIWIGYLGENIVTEIIFNYSQWASLYGDGALSLAFKRNTDVVAYPIILDHDAELHEATWTVTNTDVAIVGEAEAQLSYIVDDAVKKSEIFTVTVKNSLENGGEAPEPYQSWLDDALRIQSEIEVDKQAIEQDISEAEAEIAETIAQARVDLNDIADTAETTLNGIVADAKDYMDDSVADAQQSAQNASESAQSASISANNAFISERNARDSADEAGFYADNAQASAEQAELSVNKGGYLEADLIDGHLIIKYINIDTLEFSLVNGRLMVTYG